MLSEKGKTFLVHNNYKFYKKHTAKTNICMWMCVNNKCRAKCYTDSEKLVENKNTCFVHTYEEETALNQQKIINSCKRKAVDSVVEKPSKIIRLELTQHKNEGNLFMSDIKLISRNVQNARASCYPKIPKSRKEVHNTWSSIYVKTNRGDNFIFENDDLNEIIIFSCDTNIEFLKKLEIVYMDGTFNYCDKNFTQLYAVHGLKNSIYIPLMFCFLPDKTLKTYIELLKKINAVGINPNKFVLDFEISMHQAINIILPAAQIWGCRFHLGQA